ncbi:Solute carrier family 25 member 40 [Cyphomyrmex costatus]|uniref:Solute carrier family 25 member 40 n=1 Tax=Cyphomyrmex costatus TaxID=456900 RepID=A0A195CLC2_9HYME|nr:Solute carrier family 25 member 40 [Cyphomyrmex costatus]
MNKLNVSSNVDLDDPRFRIRPYQQIVASCTGAFITSVFVTPLDVVKIRLQTQQKAMLSNKCFLYCNGLMDHLCPCTNGKMPDWMKRNRKFNGTFDALLKISETEGIASLWSGLSPTLVLAIPATVIYFVSYEQLRLYLKDTYNREFKKKGTNMEQPFWIPILAGGIARIWAATLVSPLELIRTKMQSQKLSYAEITQTLKIVVRYSGISGLWMGLSSTLLRDVPFSAIYWLNYETIKRLYSSQQTFTFNLAAGAVAGSVSAFFTIPFDVVKTHRQIEMGEREIYSANEIFLMLIGSIIIDIAIVKQLLKTCLTNELNDDYMEMREGLDLGYNVSTMLVAVLGNPWFTNHYIYWSLSALLLSWPLRVIIEYKTQYADYQVTKLFGVNYDTPTSGEPIHASISQLSQPGSYMLAPSYSEALLMEPATTRNESEQRQENWQNREEMNVATDIVPSYSEALLYECAEQYDNRNTTMNNAYAGCTNSTILRSADDPMQILPLMPCECHCPYGRLHPPANPVASSNNLQIEASPSRCSNCGRISASTQTINADTFPRIVARKKSNESSQTTSADFIPNMISEREHRTILRDISEPNLRLQSELANTYPKENVRSLENILENEEDLPGAGKASCVNVEMILLHERQYPERQRRFPVSPSLTHHRSLSLDETTVSPKNLSTIPKTEPRSRIMVNPILNEACWKLPNSKTYYCLKSILKQNKRRYTLVTADEFQNFTEQDVNRGVDYLNSSGRGEKGNNDVRIDKLVDHSHSREKLNPIRRRMPSFEEFRSERDKMYINDQKQESTRILQHICASDINRSYLYRTLIFASPIQEVFPGDPFGGKDIVPVRNLRECSVREGDSANDSAMLIRPNRSLTVQDARSLPIDCSTMNLLRPDSITYSLPHITHSSWNNGHERKLQYLLHNRYPFEAMGTSAKVEETSRGHRNDVSFLSYNRLHSERTNRWSTSSNEYDDRSREGHPKYLSNRRRQAAGLTRSLTERRPKVARLNRNFRRSFTGRMEDYRMENAKRTNFSIETSL